MSSPANWVDATQQQQQQGPIAIASIEAASTADSIHRG